MGLKIIVILNKFGYKQLEKTVNCLFMNKQITSFLTIIDLWTVSSRIYLILSNRNDLN